MHPHELYRVGLALEKGLSIVTAALDGEPIIAPPEPDVLAAVADDDEAEAMALSWLAEAELEVERRRQIVAEELQRRRDVRRW